MSVLAAPSSTRAEIYWALHCVQCNYSFNSNVELGKLFSVMFPDSEVAKAYSMSRTKLGYQINHGLAPYFKERMVYELNNSDVFSLLFDESFNKDLQKSQMDFFVRYWNDNNQVCNRYLDSKFLGHTTAQNLKASLDSAISFASKEKLVHISMDGPKVNHSLMRLIKKERLDADLPEVVDVGTCNLHVVHGAFRHGNKATKWESEATIKAVYGLLKDSSARREDFELITGCKEFPLPFSDVRWLESKSSADRAIKIWPEVKKMISYLESLPKSKQPKCNSYVVLKESVKDNLMVTKLNFFSYVAGKFETFLRKYQGNEPLVPCMYKDLNVLIQSIGQIVFDSDTVNGLTVDGLEKLDLGDKKKKHRFRLWYY